MQNDNEIMKILLGQMKSKRIKQLKSARGIGRNLPCYCGSGKKFKRCCGKPR